MLQDNTIELSPIIEATPVAFTFDAIGWKVLFFLLFLTMLFFIYKYHLHYKKKQYRRDAIKNINTLNSTKNISINELVSGIMFQLKQTALHTYNKQAVASLKGTNWLQFLDKKVKGSHFLKDQKTITDAVYKDTYNASNQFNPDHFVKMSLKWIKNHA